MASRALRYPKPVWLNGNNNADSSATETTGGTVNYKVSLTSFGVVLAPARYSQVRKVRFYLTIRNISATQLVGASLRIWVSSVSGVNTEPDAQTLTPGAAAASYWTDSSIVNRIFSKIGTAAQNISNTSTSTGTSSLIEVEFDRFDGLSNDFFQCWDSVTDVDEYISFRPAVARTSGPAANGNVSFFTMGAVVVQAPAAVNSSLTYVQLWRSIQTNGSGQSAFDSADATAEAQIRGAHRWRYNASDWDGVTAVYLVVRGIKSGGTQFDFRVQRLTSNTQGSGSTTTIASQTVTFGTSAALGTWRSADLLSLLVDGGDYVFDYRNTTGTGEVGAYLEIVQANHTRTVTYHEVSCGTSAADNGLTSALSSDPLIFPQAALFDPTWYANFPDERILKRKLVGQLNHRIAGLLDPTLEMAWNSNLSEDQNGNPGSGLTATSRVVTPLVTATPINTAAWKYAEGDIVGNDPIEQAGDRKLFMRLEGTWTSPIGVGTAPDSPGSLNVYYALDVPNTEVLELGPIFGSGPFDPEGCAATAAGLGDPGVLVITNGSTIPKKFDPAALVIQDAGIPTPFLGEYPTSMLVESIAASPLTGLGEGLYVYRYTLRNVCTRKESNPNPDDIVVDTTGATPAAKVTISFAGVRIPGDPQVTEICLYRTVLGGAFPVMAKVGCFDFSITTVFVDTLSDLALDFLNEPLSLLNAPMPCVSSVVDFRERLFGCGDIPQLGPAGTVSVDTGSDIVVGSDLVDWDRCLEGKTIQVAGDCRGYEILRVMPPVVGESPPIQRLQLTEEYEQTTKTGALYTICGRPSRLYFSEPLEPEYWPEINFIDVEPGDGDRLMGLASNFDRLVVCKRSKTYVVTFDENPVLEGTKARRISSDVGCVAPRSFAQVENGTVWLAERGLAIFDGRGVQHVPESVEMNDLIIDPDNDDYVRRDENGRVIGAVGVYYQKREQYLLLLPSKRTERGADMMLVWNVKLRNVTLLRFCQEFSSMVVGKDTDGNDRVYLGDTNGFVWIYDVGDTDGVGSPNATGTVRGTVSSSGLDAASGASFVEDAGASFIEGGLPSLAGLSGVAGLSGAFSGAPGDNLGIAGACLFFRPAGSAPDDAWDSRIVFAATATRLYVTPAVTIDLTGYEYMLGPIELDLRFKPTNYGSDDRTKRDWRHAVTFVPQEQASQLRVEYLTDLASTDELATETAEPTVGQGRLFDMSQSKGRLTAPLPRQIHSYVAVRVHNHAPDEPVELLNHSIMFEVQEGR